jgi:hypothetical protein
MVPVKIKTRNQVLTDIIHDGKKHPTGWNAAFGQDSSLLSNDCYIFHPSIGVYLLKEYHKNPYEIKGIGSKIARHVDEDITEKIQKTSGDFGIIQGDLRRILTNINKGIPAKHILQSAIDGKDLGITIPVKGSASTSQDTFHSLSNEYSTQQKKLKNSFEKIASDDGMYTSYG